MNLFKTKVRYFNSILYISRNLLLLRPLEMVIFRIFQSALESRGIKLDARLKESKVRILWIHASLNPQTVSYCFNGWLQLFTHSVEGETFIIKIGYFALFGKSYQEICFYRSHKKDHPNCKIWTIRITHILTK